MPAANRIDAIKFIGLWGAHYTINNYSKEPPKIVLVIFSAPIVTRAQHKHEPILRGRVAEVLSLVFR